MIVAAAGLAAVAALLLVTGPHLVDLYRSQIETCSANHDCATAQTSFLRTDRSLFNLLGFLVLFVPAVLGVFLGAPLVARELETGTHRLAWTQSVSRTRWLAVKVAVIGLVGMAVTGLVSVFVTWWAHPLDRVQIGPVRVLRSTQRRPRRVRSVRGGARRRLRHPPPSHTAGHDGHASRLRGRSVGIHVLRPLASPAAVANHHLPLVRQRRGVRNHTTARGHVRGHQPDPARTPWWSPGTASTRPAALRPLSACTISSKVGVRQSHVPLSLTGTGSSHVGPANQSEFNHCIQRLSGTFHAAATTYQPPSRYWPLQWSEFGIFMAAALILVNASLSADPTRARLKLHVGP